MENPDTWGRAEQIVAEVFAEYYAPRGHYQPGQPLIGLSLTRQITDALRAEGLLIEPIDDYVARKHSGPPRPRPQPPAEITDDPLPESLRAEAAKRTCGDPDCNWPDHLQSDYTDTLNPHGYWEAGDY